MLTPVWYLNFKEYLLPQSIYSYTEMCSKITKKCFKLQSSQKTFFSAHAQIWPKVNFWQEGRWDSIFLPKFDQNKVLS